MQVVLDNFMTFRIGVSQPARHLIFHIVLITRRIGEMIGLFITWLNLGHIIIDR